MPGSRLGFQLTVVVPRTLLALDSAPIVGDRLLVLFQEFNGTFLESTQESCDNIASRGDETWLHRLPACFWRSSQKKENAMHRTLKVLVH